MSESRDLDEEEIGLRRLKERFIMSHDCHVARNQRKKSSDRKRYCHEEFEGRTASLDLSAV